MAPAEFFKAAWIRSVPRPRMRVLADVERLRGFTVESPIVEERTLGMSPVLAWRAA